MATTTEKLAIAAKKHWEQIAKEPLIIDVVSGVCYAFGSEIACLRLYKAFNGMGTVNFSENMQTWYFCNDKAA